MRLCRVIGWFISFATAALAFLVLAGPSQADTTDFVSTWRPANISAGSSADNQVRLPLDATGSYSFTVD